MTWLRAICVTVLFTGALCATYAYLLIEDPSELAGRYDVHRYYGPENFYLDYALSQGELPFWNFLTYCGKPTGALPQTFTFYPPNLLRSLLTSEVKPANTQKGLVVLIGLHLLFAGLGVYLLARLHGMSTSAAVVSGLVFMFSALMVRRACEYHFLFTIAWMPYTLAACRWMLRSERWSGKFFYGALAAVFLGMSVLGGFIQVLQIMGVMIFVYVFLYRLSHLHVWKAPVKAWPWRSWQGDVVGLIVLGLVSALIAGAVLLPVTELAGFSARQKGDATVRLYASLHDQSFTKIGRDYVAYAGLKYESEALRNCGILALLLALAAFTSRRWREVMIFGTMYFVLFDCSFGPPMPISRLVEMITPFTTSSYLRAYDFAMLPMSLLVGLGLEALCQPMKRRWMNHLRNAVLYNLGLVCLATLYFSLSGGNYLRVWPTVYIVPAAGIVFIALTGWSASPRYVRLAMAWVMPLLVFGETLAWNVHYVPFLTKKGAGFNNTPERFEGGAVMPQDNYRGTDPIGNRELYTLGMSMNGAEPLHIARVRDTISGERRGKYYYRVLRPREVTADNARGLLFLKRSFWITQRWTEGPLPGKHEVYQSAATVFLENPGPIPLPQLPRSEALASAISPGAMARGLNPGPEFYGLLRGKRKFNYTFPAELPSQVGGRAPGPAGVVHSVLRLHYTSTVPARIYTTFQERGTRRKEAGRSTALVRAPVGIYDIPLPDYPFLEARVTLELLSANGTFQFNKAEILSDPLDEDGYIASIRRRINSVEVQLAGLPGPRLLTFVDAHYPGWHAYVDGEETDIYLANGAFKAIVVPKGTHHVRFQFASKRMYAGIALSLGGLFVAFMLMAITFGRRAAIDVIEIAPPEWVDRHGAALLPEDRP